MQESLGTETWLHKIDIRAKLIITLVASISTIALSGIWGLTVLFLFSFCYVVSMKKYKVMLVAYGILFVTALLAVGCITFINKFIPVMKSTSYLNLAIPFIRMAVMVNLILPLAFTTRVQGMLTALKSFRLALYIYLPVAVMIRFIPTFASDIKQVVEAAKIRGMRLNPLSFFVSPILMTRMLFMPLLFRSLRTSEELGIAAELKGLGLNDDMKPYKTLHWQKSDTGLIFASLTAIVVSVIIHTLTYVPKISGGMG